MKRMRFGKRQSRQALPPCSVRLVIDGPAALVLHHRPLRVQLLLRHCRKQPAHAIRLEPENKLELIRRHRLEVVCPIQPGGPVQRAAGALYHLEMLVRGDVGRALKEHVLEQVREAGASGPFVGGADVIPEVHRDDRRRVVL